MGRGGCRINRTNIDPLGGNYRGLALDFFGITKKQHRATARFKPKNKAALDRLCSLLEKWKQHALTKTEQKELERMEGKEIRIKLH